jgi:hypothetical protein
MPHYNKVAHQSKINLDRGFAIVTSNGLKVIGGYEPMSYWSFEYGYNFNFNSKCAIEIF